MDKLSTQQTAPPGRSTKQECCTDLKCESGLKNNYFEGKRLTADSFRVEQRYLVERRQLLNRAIHGCGVVYGYPISGGQSGRLTIGPGLALDECGRELLQVAAVKVSVDDLLVLDEKGARADLARTFSAAGQAIGKPPACWLLSVHYAEQYSGPVTVNDPCRCEHQEWEHTCETVRYSLTRIPCAECCREFDCELTCICGTGHCCDDAVATEGGKEQPHANKPFQRGGCRCLCEHLTRLQPDAECGPLCEIEEPCAHVRVDLRHGVPLACVALVKDDCDRWTLGPEVDECSPRSLVKRNDLLFDLIRGCDLTRISEIGWKDWHRRKEPVPFEELSAALGAEDHKQDEYVTRDFWVRFSRPVRRETLRPDCFAITAMSGEREGGWWDVLRVPIVRVETDAEQWVEKATIVVDGAWVEDGVRGRRSLFMGSDTWIEIEVRGDFIVDCNGQTVDANALGLSPGPTGNGTPGGTFVSTFRVASVHPYAAADRVKGASS
jgi:hypothetical protein